MNKGIIDLNALLEKEYNYYSNQNILNQHFTQIELNGKREKFWFKYKGEIYLFKRQAKNSYDVYGELVAEAIARILNIECAQYYPATFDGDFGIISKSFLKKNEQLILGMEIISNVLNQYFFNNEELQKQYGIYDLKPNDTYNKLNNLEDIWCILDLYFKDNPNKIKIVKSLIDQLVDLLFFDIITLQGDRHIQNWGIIKNKENGFIRLAPIYDNSNICGLNRKQVITTFNNMFKSLKTNTGDYAKTFDQLQSLLYHSKLVFSASEDDIIDIAKKKRKNNLEVVDNFIRISDYEYIYRLLSYIDTIDNYGVENIINDCCNYNKIEMPEEVKKHFINSIFLNSLLIRERIENYLNERNDNIGKQRFSN